MAPLPSPFHGTSCNARAEQTVEQSVAGVRVFGRRRRQPAVIDSEMAREAQLGRRRRDLALAVGLHHAARDQRIGAGLDRGAQHVVELAQLVATKAEPRAVLALHPQRGPPRCASEARHRLERRRRLNPRECKAERRGGGAPSR